MTVRRVLSFGVSTLALASWFSAASTPDVPPPVAHVTPRAPSAIDRSSALLQAEIARLHDRLVPGATPSRSRDLFRFNQPKPRRASVPTTAVDETEPPAPVPPALPALQLIGVAEDASPDGVVRTAILSGFGDVFLVKAGDTVSGRYRVDQVSADAVQITSLSTSTASTLALR